MRHSYIKAQERNTPITKQLWAKTGYKIQKPELTVPIESSLSNRNDNQNVNMKRLTSYFEQLIKLDLEVINIH